MKLRLLSALLLLPCLALAENLLSDGLSWTTMVSGCEPGSQTTIHKYTIEGSTIVDGFAALKVLREDGTQVAVIRNDGDKVYSFSHITGQWLLAYDFSLKEGDVCEIGMFDTYSINHTSDDKYFVKCVSVTTSEEYGGWPVMHFEMYDSPEFTEEYFFGEGDWLVGIGNVVSVTDNWFTDDFLGRDGRILTVEKDGDVICQYSSDSLGEAAAVEMSVRVDGMAVRVAGVDAGCEVRAYGVDGSQVARTVASADGCAVLALPRAGLYLVATPTGTAKIMVR